MGNRVPSPISRKSIKRYLKIVKKKKLPIIVLDQNLCWVLANESLQELTELKNAKQIYQYTIQDLLPTKQSHLSEDTIPYLLTNLRCAFSKTDPTQLILQYSIPEGSNGWVVLSISKVEVVKHELLQIIFTPMSPDQQKEQLKEKEEEEEEEEEKEEEKEMEKQVNKSTIDENTDTICEIIEEIRKKVKNDDQMESSIQEQINLELDQIFELHNKLFQEKNEQCKVLSEELRDTRTKHKKNLEKLNLLLNRMLEQVQSEKKLKYNLFQKSLKLKKNRKSVIESVQQLNNETKDFDEDSNIKQLSLQLSKVLDLD
ncbi:hypothetical protein M0813_03307 [Anaeramoeba flamelloides]|uniref:Uncharacterized protein n=1 Tax=Anaeramoeba flamelloides TaxID=1746091 RepID=A0ABQ8XZP4_9EUKA|nr:hypothetical protein M0813_03307 [Anaeramoeba flamelloides]